MERVRCKQCHSTYALASEKLDHKETNTIECVVCGLTIKDWCGNTSYKAVLLKRGRGSERFAARA